ncbi:hypothetical protein NH288_04785 [Anaerococcus sp. NML200537]|uniref:hypothetical protein n=1 Tax=Anaerococcus sp. NML200537 TaxID=2954485 RepID=UPI002237CA16|nr:hypothetical protein [Anaerococcus sp. NML200537]MCW6701399.1 hypothetical protein [Anaerococcus sp. NML200537]
MLINPNLYESKSTLEYRGGDKLYYNGVFIDVPTLIDGETYTLSCDLDRVSLDGQLLDEIVSVGPARANGSTIYEKPYGYTNTDVSNNKIVYTFKYIPEIKYIWDFANEGKKTKVKAVYSKIKLEKGKEKTQYVPNKNTLETAKRPYFIGGGYVQRGLSNLVSTLSNLLLGRRLQREN